MARIPNHEPKLRCTRRPASFLGAWVGSDLVGCRMGVRQRGERSGGYPRS